MPIVARVQEDFPRDLIQIVVAQRTQAVEHLARTTHVLDFSVTPPSWHALTDEERMQIRSQDELLTLPGEDVARAVYDALGRYFQGHDDERMRRKDFEHEQERRDYLEGVVCMLADKLATTPPPAQLAEIRSFDPRA